MEKKLTFADKIKNSLLLCEIRNQCCENSFTAGFKAFQRSRTNKFTDATIRYCEKLREKKSAKSNAFAFLSDESLQSGYSYSIENGERQVNPTPKVCKNCAQHLLRGAFLAAGRATDKKNNLHLEIVMPNEKILDLVKEILAAVGIEVKHTVRRGELLLYLKKSETIEDFLSYIGAATVSFKLINDKIISNFRIDANRQKNCDTSNINRAITAAGTQIAAINYLMSNDFYQNLPQALKMTAQIRIENPSASLAEITQFHDEKISKSGVNHRLRKIVIFAENKGF